MNTSQTLIAELKQESVSTKKILEAVPFDKSGWKPHEKSMTLIQLSQHITDLVGWTDMVVNSNELDLASHDRTFKPSESTQELMNLFNENLAKSLQSLEKLTEEVAQQEWTLRIGDQILVKLPKAAVIRNLCFNHNYHHRGQLGVYLRLLDVKVPGIYGPSADELL